MKKYLLGLTAVVVAIGFSAFTVKKTTPFYYEYISGAQNSTGSYQTPNATSPGLKSGTSVLAWIRVDAADDISGPTSDEFTTEFNALNTHNVASLSLNDETEDHIYLEKKTN